MDQLLTQVAQNVEKQLDRELERLETLDVDDLEAIRTQRMAEMKKRQQLKQEWLTNGHGEYTELDREKDFFGVCNKSVNVVCHFFKQGSPHCKVLDMHLKKLAQKHIETRFVGLDVERAPFLTGRLKIRTIPTMALVKDNNTKHYIAGFTELGDTDEFTTELLEWVLARYEIIDYNGDLSVPPEEARRQKSISIQSKKTIKSKYDSDDDLSD